MFIATHERSYLRILLELVLLALVIFALGSLLTNARQKNGAPKPAPTAVRQADDPGADEPLLREYRGVRLGMTAEEARLKLGEPADKSDQQDFYNISDNESAQIFYDASRKVVAVSVHYVGDLSGAPTPKSLFGADAAPRADGSVYKLVQYPRAGYWVSYNRTAGDAPIVTVSMRRTQ